MKRHLRIDKIMTTEEIEKAVKDYADNSTLDSYLLLKLDFRNGVEFANKHWQEKTRWRSLEKEPPTNYTYDKMYLLRTGSGIRYLVSLPYEESVKEVISCGFIDWKEIE